MLAGGAALLIVLFKTRTFSLKEIEKTLLFLGWLTLFLYTAMYFLLDPKAYIEYGVGLVTYVGNGKYEFADRFEFVAFALFYYLFMGFRMRSTKNYLRAIPFVLLILGLGGRSLSLSVLLATTILLIMWGTVARVLKVTLIMTATLFLIVIIQYTYNAEYTEKRIEKYSDAFSVVVNQEETEDPSANARILETAIAIPYIQEHWLIGNGQLSYQWQGGYKEILGYFYPSDIGFIGILYVYGIAGTLILFLQYFYVSIYLKKIPTRNMDPMRDASKGLILYIFVHSFVTGAFALNPGGRMMSNIFPKTYRIVLRKCI